MMEGLGIVMKATCLLVGQITVYGGGSLLLIGLAVDAYERWRDRD